MPMSSIMLSPETEVNTVMHPDALLSGKTWSTATPAIGQQGSGRNFNPRMGSGFHITKEGRENAQPLEVRIGLKKEKNIL